MHTANKIEQYLNLPWTYTVETAVERDRPIYIIRVNELPGVATDAPTLDEAMKLLKEAMHGLFEMYLEDGEVDSLVDKVLIKPNKQ